MKRKTQGLKENVSWITMWESLGSGETLILDRRELETRRGFGFLQQQCCCKADNLYLFNRSLFASASIGMSMTMTLTLDFLPSLDPVIQSVRVSPNRCVEAILIFRWQQSTEGGQ